MIVKAYGSLDPAGEEALEAVRGVLESWFIDAGAVELEGDLLRISFEGDVFPDDEVVDALRPFLSDASRGKLDILDLEEWTLHRYFFTYGTVRDNKVTLDKALETCSMKSGL
ncbi:MAG: hypothetical protein MJ061_00495 [Mailhella sp.]|nr:hypothetical protein [Mailhella sp.]